MKKRRIAYLVTGLHAGGAETMLYHLLRGFDREQFDTIVISLMDRGKLGDSIEELGVPVHTVGMRQGKPTMGGALRIRNLLKETQPDLIQGWMYHSNLAAQFVGSLSRKPVLWCIQNSFESFKVEKPLTRFAIRMSARMSHLPEKIVFVSHESRAQHERIGFASDRSCVIPNGVDPTLFVPSESARRSVRDELGVPEETLLIGLMARYHPQKDHPNFLRAAALLAQTRPHVQFVLAGMGVSRDNDALRVLADVPELQSRVHLLGAREDMPRITAALDIATSSSSYGEALSLAVAEAMACAVPCVVTRVGDSPRLVGESGITVPPGDAPALTHAWAEMLDVGKERRCELGSSARRRVEEFYSLQSIVCRYEELYQLVS